MRVLVAGHVCLDLIPDLPSRPSLAPGTLTPVGPLRVGLGGCVGNTSRALQRLSVPIQIGIDTAVDEAGEMLRSLIRSSGLEGTVQLREGLSTSYSVVVESAGRDRLFWHHAGMNDGFDGSGLDLAGVAILHVGYPSLLATLRAEGGRQLRALFAKAKSRGITTSLDLAVIDPSARDDVDWSAFVREVLPLTDVLSPSAEDLRSLARFVDKRWLGCSPEELADDLVRRGVAVAMVTAGADGLALVAGDASRLVQTGASADTLGDWVGTRIRVPAVPPSALVSTNGAGDAATAGLLAGIVRRATPREAATLAATAASLAVAGWPEEPPHDQRGAET